METTSFLTQVRNVAINYLPNHTSPKLSVFYDYFSVVQNTGTAEDAVRFAEDAHNAAIFLFTAAPQAADTTVLSSNPPFSSPSRKPNSDLLDFMELEKKGLLLAAPDDFDAYMRYIEWNREPEKRFYTPRRKQLRPIATALQDLADDKLDLLTISTPPGIGKSGLAIFFITWLAGKHPDQPILTGSHSNAFIRGVYDECLRVLDANGEYLWRDVFPHVSLTNTNAKDCRIDLGKRKRFETLEFTSIGTGNAGLYRAVQLLYCDDLVSGLEVALSHDRLEKLWDTYRTDLRQRKMNACKELHIATRWSVHDVIGHLENLYEGNPRARFIVIPALDENDQSNFDYAYGVGFSTESYHEQRRIMDEVSWLALYMNQPIEREGLLYHPDELQRYFELPQRDPDAILAVCDTKDRGEDYCAMPIVYQYGQQFFVEEFICDNANPDLVESKLTQALLKHHVDQARFESNAAGGRIAQKVQEEVTAHGGRTKIVTKYTTSNKETRIINAAGYVKEHFLFKDASSAQPLSRDYETALRQITTYSMAGRNKHDDAADALAMLVDFIDAQYVGGIEIFRRPF